MTSEPSISSPCNHVCAVHPTARICVGCGRALDEIARWIALSEIERMAIMAQLPARLAALNAAKASAVIA
jgi:uncharacterized protein